jgi:hypothetical protein
LQLNADAATAPHTRLVARFAPPGSRLRLRLKS